MDGGLSINPYQSPQIHPEPEGIRPYPWHELGFAIAFTLIGVSSFVHFGFAQWDRQTAWAILFSTVALLSEAAAILFWSAYFDTLRLRRVQKTAHNCGGN